MNTPYPWHRQAWLEIERNLAGDRLPHAMLLHGPPSSGVGHFADLLVERVLTRGAPQGTDVVQMIRAGAHPDYYELKPEKKGGGIVIEQVRALVAFMQLRGHEGGRRIVSIRPAEAMNRGACNSLLKVLEEPPGAALLLLLAHRPYMLPATVLSRVIRLDLTARDKDAVRTWLAAQGHAETEAESAAFWGIGPLAGGPEAALGARILEVLCPAGAVPAVPDAAKHWQGLGTERVLQWLAGATRMLIRECLCEATPVRAPERLRQVAAGLDLRALLEFYDRIESIARLLFVAGSSELTLLEDVLLAWRRALGTGRVYR